jgi:molybdopterin converting factor small subunit
MPTVFIPTQMKELAGGVAQVEIHADTVREVIAELGRRFPCMTERLCVDGELSPALQVSVDHVMTRRLSTSVAANSEVHFLPALGGG